MTRWLAVTLLSGVALAQSAVSTQGVHRMEITLERMEGKTWKVVDPRLVVPNNDRIRFKFKANFDGYLYVTNQSTSGHTQLLFPRADTGSVNQIETGKEYVVPATAGYFRVGGPPGYDVISWLVSPIELSQPDISTRVPQPSTPSTDEAGTQAVPAPPSEVTLKPRCNDTIFKARGDCVDDSAGLKAQPKDAASRELIFIREKKSAVVSSPVALTGPVVYEFHLAHK